MDRKLERFHKYMKEYDKMVWRNVDNQVRRHLVADIMQETFLRLYEHLDYLPDEKVKPWLLITSSNIARDYGRKGGKYESISVDDEDTLDYINQNFQATLHTIEGIENKKAAGELLQTALELLYEKNPVWYYIMVDSCMMEMTTKEIAKALNLTATNVDVMKIRARKFLHKELGTRYREIL